MGAVWRRRTAIEEGHAAVHKTIFRNSVQRERLEELTFVGPDAAVVRFYSTLTGEERSPDKLIRSRKFLLVTRRDGTVRVRELRSRLALLACDPAQALLTAKQAAQHLGISSSYVGILLKRGIIPGTQVAPGTVWWVDPNVLDSEAAREALRALSNRRPVQRGDDDRTLRIPGM
jgi:hypothetical protein